MTFLDVAVGSLVAAGVLATAHLGLAAGPVTTSGQAATTSGASHPT